MKKYQPKSYYRVDMIGVGDQPWNFCEWDEQCLIGTNTPEKFVLEDAQYYIKLSKEYDNKSGSPKYHYRIIKVTEEEIK